MAAYIIAQVSVNDPGAYETYKKLAQDAIARHGGRYLVRGGETTMLEGNKEPGRMVVLEFASVEQAKSFYHSPEYSAARRARDGIAKMDMIVVQGV
ncbi:MAG: DUF1330 domain-containing protein [Alphaproteobacteria bacterium]|nr:DUF1330 domain-containing protein [Alphaproteobacteria bacterium]